MSRVLVIDDEVEVRNILTDFLGRKNYEVITAEDGPRGLDQLDAFRPDLVLLDVRMPGMDGIEVLREIKKRRPGTCVLMITAWGDQTSANEAIRLGANDYITKPLSFAQLETHLSVHLLMQSEE